MATHSPRNCILLRALPVPVEAAAAPMEILRTHVEDALGREYTEQDASAGMRIVQRALDTRHRQPRFMYTVEVDVPDAKRLIDSGVGEAVRDLERYQVRLQKAPEGPPPVVVGAGPAGLFAALTLAEAGWAPIVIERGKPVETRARDVSQLYAHGVLNPESNVCYGEGGAGTFSDGKLYTRINKPRVLRFMESLVAHGADPEILINNRPHLGTDRLIALLRALRAHLESLGTVFRFESRVERFEVSAESGAMTGLRLADNEHIDATSVILGTGHSARDVWLSLQDIGLQLETRPFAVGFRVEHAQQFIDDSRYGALAGHEALPAADYRLTHRGKDERGVYSFCMCPGGVVVTTPTSEGELCINGMSHASRSGKFANSALVVTVGLEDFAAAGHTGVFAGVDFQRQIEMAGHDAGGGSFVAPAQKIADFVSDRASSSLPSTSYRRGLQSADLGKLYPPVVIDALRHGLGAFDRKMRGFVSNEGVLIGVETRTASPVRVPRGDDRQASGCQGLYPCGEGMGYGGGIASAAVDGMASAEALLEQHGALRETA